VYHRIGVALSDFVAVQLADVPDGDVARISAELSAAPAGEVDYGRYARAFAKAYLLVNYWKAVAVLERVRPAAVRSVADLGSGPGSATVACLAYLAATTGAPENGAQVRLLDRSKEQLNLAEDLLSRLFPDDYSAGRFTFEHTDCALSTVDSDSSDLVIVSHLLTENPIEADGLLGAIGNTGGASGRLILIERFDDPVWLSWIAKASRNDGGWSHGIEEILLESEHSRHLRRWVAAWSSYPRLPESYMARVVDAYFEAWRMQSVDRLKEVFSADATYSTKPFLPPIVGLDGIEEYWREKVLTQESPVVRIITRSSHANVSNIEWEARFSRDGNAYQIQGSMTLEFDSTEQKVRHLREYYETNATF
jgi:SAM-dependent methyltransferase